MGGGGGGGGRGGGRAQSREGEVESSCHLDTHMTCSSSKHTGK